MKRLFISFLMVLFLCGGFLGCSAPGIKIVGEKSEAFAAYKSAHIAAAEEFNKHWEKYLNTWDIMPPEVQKRWTEEINPLFLKGAALLDKWQAHVLSGTFLPDSQDEYLALKDQLFLLLMQEKLKESK